LQVHHAVEADLKVSILDSDATQINSPSTTGGKLILSVQAFSQEDKLNLRPLPQIQSELVPHLILFVGVWTSGPNPNE
jgi:hypothetical protein